MTQPPSLLFIVKQPGVNLWGTKQAKKESAGGPAKIEKEQSSGIGNSNEAGKKEASAAQRLTRYGSDGISTRALACRGTGTTVRVCENDSNSREALNDGEPATAAVAHNC